MAAALRQLQSPEIRQKAANLGAAIRAEPDGVAVAVRLIEKVVDGKENQP
jgi:hypothetical protein